MLYNLVLGLSSFLLFFLLKSNRFRFYRLAENSLSLLNDLLSSEEDDVKVKIIQKSTNKLLAALLMMMLVILLSIVFATLPLLCLNWINDPKNLFEFDLTSFSSIVAISIGGSIPFVIPVKRKSSYSELSQLLHRLILDNYEIGSKLFRWEKKKLKADIKPKDEFLIVSGLARSGTTSLMNDLLKSNVFSSLSYGNMPFLLNPISWRKIYKPKKGKLKERSHKDGIKIGLDSNEALEEYFFKLKTKDAFIKNDILEEHQITEETYQDYITYQRLIRESNDAFYLAKNNNFILRYRSIRSLNKDFSIVLLFRDPLTHSASLLEQHQSYKNQQEQDPFVLDYMNWLGHHEFGENQKVFSFSAHKLEFQEDKTSLNYWLEVWLNYYQFVSEIEDPKLILLSYQDYCNSPNQVFNAISKRFGQTADKEDLKPYRKQRSVEYNYDKELLYKAEGLYNLLLKKRFQLSD